jgi:hypothetical protein
MGWFFSSQTRSELIAELVAPYETERSHVKVIDYALCDDVLWSVVEATAKVAGVYRNLLPGQSVRYIRCDLLKYDDKQWGYKPMDESVHPVYYSCPLRFLDMTSELCAKWRQEVRAYHEQRLFAAEVASLLAA